MDIRRVKNLAPAPAVPMGSQPNLGVISGKNRTEPWDNYAMGTSFRNKLQPMLPCVRLLVPDLVTSLTTDNDGDAL